MGFFWFSLTVSSASVWITIHPIPTSFLYLFLRAVRSLPISFLLEYQQHQRTSNPVHWLAIHNFITTINVWFFVSWWPPCAVSNGLPLSSLCRWYLGENIFFYFLILDFYFSFKHAIFYYEKWPDPSLNYFPFMIYITCEIFFFCILFGNNVNSFIRLSVFKILLFCSNFFFHSSLEEIKIKRTQQSKLCYGLVPSSIVVDAWCVLTPLSLCWS